MDISVIIPTHNRPSRLRDCLDCLAAQRLDEAFETIVVDDASDHPAAVKNTVVDSELEDVTLLRCNESQGPAAARNKGASWAAGDLLVFTDDDTLPDEDWLTQIKDAATEYDLIEGRVAPAKRATSPYKRIVASENGGEFLTANLAVTRDLFDEVGGFETAYQDAFREDTDFGFAARDAGASATFADDAVVYHPVYDRSWRDIVVDTWKFRYDPLLYSRFPNQYRESIVYPFERYTPAYLSCLAVMILLPFFGAVLPLLGATEMQAYGFSGNFWTVSTYAVGRALAALVFLVAVVVGCYRFAVNPLALFDPRGVRELV